jgi:prevent-host-death family protein
MAVTASEACQRLFSLIGEVNDDQAAVEIVSEKSTAFLVPADEYRSLKETVYRCSRRRTLSGSGRASPRCGTAAWGDTNRSTEDRFTRMAGGTSPGRPTPGAPSHEYYRGEHDVSGRQYRVDGTCLTRRAPPPRCEPPPLTAKL